VVSLDFSVTHSFRLYHGPGVDSAPSENEYQEHFLEVKAAGAWGWQPHNLHVPNVMKIWEPKPPGTLWATPGLLRDSFTFTKRNIQSVNCYEYKLLRCKIGKLHFACMIYIFICGFSRHCHCPRLCSVE